VALACQQAVITVVPSVIGLLVLGDKAPSRFGILTYAGFGVTVVVVLALTFADLGGDHANGGPWSIAAHTAQKGFVKSHRFASFDSIVASRAGSCHLRRPANAGVETVHMRPSRRPHRVAVTKMGAGGPLW
jgi:hypothetical protein